MKIVLLHPTGNANVRAITKALVHAQLLAKFFTCVALFKSSIPFRLAGIGPLREFRRRSFPQVLKPYTHVRPFRELGRMAAQKIGWRPGLLHEKGIFCIDRVYQDLDVHVSKRLQNVKAVYAYEDGALQSFRMARSRGVRCLYDLPTGYWRAHRTLLEEEVKLRPDWAMTFKCFHDSITKLARKDSELALADVVFVASSFAKKTLELFPAQLPPVHLIPYGFPEVTTSRDYEPLVGRKLRLLFVGGLSQLKGLANLFEAVDFLEEQVELTIVGRKMVENCTPLNEGLKKHRWYPSLPHEEVLKLMRSQDVFVFPSLFEGYGLVVAEAMSQGTPVITTRRTCGADFITEDKNGWIIDAGNTASLIAKIRAILAKPDCLARVGKEALKTAANFPMSLYGERMVNVIEKVVNDR